MEFRLHEEGICRIFFSSPFTGMEEERDELTKRFWPRIESLCSSKGLQFCAVDMRWGITAQSAEAARVIDICLRECSRSDLFVGFFGQRYGWHGEKDEVLQKNFDNAKQKFPWIDKYRDRSMTELEFMEGHLNSPGKIPACICFRDKSYDDKMYEKARLEDNASKMKAYIVESEDAKYRIQQLKKDVIKTKDNSLGVLESYTSPREAAEFMFECIWKFLKNTLGTESTSLSYRELSLAQHDAYAATRSKLFIGRQDVLDKLSNNKGNILLSGDSGAGKSALIATWQKRENNKDSRHIFITHYIGCGSDTTDILHILRRINIEILHEKKDVEFQTKEKTIREIRETNDVKELIRIFQGLVKELKKKEIQCTIVLDGLEKVEKEAHKIFAPLYWIPKCQEENVKFVFCTTTIDTENIEELKSRDYYEINLPLLDRDEKEQLCLTLLRENSKEMSKEQLSKLVDIEQTRNPLYLKVLISELCAFGSYRLINNKIDDLTSTKDISQLFQKMIIRLKKDYEDPEANTDMVERTLCGLALSKYGFSENDLKNFLNVKQHLWSPFYYALEKFLLNRQSMLQIAHWELTTMIKKQFLEFEDQRIVHIESMANFFYNIFEERVRRSEKLSMTLMNELPELLIKAGKQKEFITVLTNPQVISYFEKKNAFEIISYMNLISMDKIVNALLDSIMSYPSLLYSFFQRNYLVDTSNLSYKIFLFYDVMQNISDKGKFYVLSEKSLRRGIDIIDYCKNKSEKWRTETKYLYKHRLGCLLSDLMKMPESLKIHEEVLEWRKSTGCLSEIQASYHSIGTLYLHDQNYDLALDYFNKASEAQTELAKNPEKTEDYNGFNNKHSFAATHTNLGLVHLRKGYLSAAERELTTALELYKEYFFGEQTLDIAYCFHNLGMVYRRKKDYEKADELYKKSLSIKLKYLGEKSIDVGLTYMNLGTLALVRKDSQKFFEYSFKCYEIMKECHPDQSHHQIIMAKENLAHGCFLTGKKEECEELFLETLIVHEERKDFEKGLVILYKEMMYYLKEKRQFKTIFRFLAPVMKTKMLRSYHYIVMDEVLENLNDENIKEREFCLDYGIEKFPENKELMLFYGSKFFDRDFVELRDISLKIMNILKEKKGNEKLPFILYSKEMMENDKEKYEEKVFLLISESLNLWPNNEEILALKAYALCKTKKYQECVDILRSLVENCKDEFIIKSYFEEILDELGNAHDDESKTLLEEVTLLLKNLQKIK